jgi:hypothetical protein
MSNPEIIEPMPVPMQAPLTLLDRVDRAREQGCDIAIVKEYMALYREERDDQRRMAFIAAFTQAKAEMPIIAKTRQVGFDSRRPGAARTSYKYEDLAEIVRAVTPILSRYGLSHRFDTERDGDTIWVTCVIEHVGGHRFQNRLPALPDKSGNKNDIQAQTSTITYLSRTLLKSSLGLAAGEDDDGAGSDLLGPIFAEQVGLLRKKIHEAGLLDARVCEKYQIEKLEELDRSILDDALESIALYKAERDKLLAKQAKQ